MKKTSIKKIEVQGVTDELVAAIQNISTAMQVLKNSRLSERALILLLRDATGLSLRDIKKVLEALPNLEKWYLR